MLLCVCVGGGFAGGFITRCGRLRVCFSGIRSRGVTSDLIWMRGSGLGSGGGGQATENETSGSAAAHPACEEKYTPALLHTRVCVSVCVWVCVGVCVCECVCVCVYVRSRGQILCYNISRSFVMNTKRLAGALRCKDIMRCVCVCESDTKVFSNKTRNSGEKPVRKKNRTNETNKELQ